MSYMILEGNRPYVQGLMNEYLYGAGADIANIQANLNYNHRWPTPAQSMSALYSAWLAQQPAPPTRAEELMAIGVYEIAPE